ncbi:uncharacterized protein LOC119189041 [Manduca sexta]|uniref:uncharacterized protein LOC119189041 n=1 Tax=Manduca sexta TaxID=7130 RepID=UPI00188E75C3|nr:uncharacterized protein LOC119189041 [Manduca sexta]
MFMSLEFAIENNEDATFTLTNEPFSINFEQQLLNILGIQNIDTYDDNIALISLGLNNLLFHEINALIYSMYGRNYPVEYLQQMTIQNLLMLGDKDSKTEVKTGLDALFSYVGPDEIRASETIVVMPSSYSDYNSSEFQDVEVDPSGTYLFMMPGFEGHYEVFTLMCSRLKIKAVTFQTGLEFQEDNISEMAQRIFNVRLYKENLISLN